MAVTTVSKTSKKLRSVVRAVEKAAHHLRLKLKSTFLFSSDRQTVGALGERYARTHLSSQGLKIVACNWRCRAGEVDLIAFDGEELVFAEVKTRRAGAIAERELFASITAAKKRKLRALAQIFLLRYFRDKPRPAIRIDALGVILRNNLSLQEVTHLRGVV